MSGPDSKTIIITGSSGMVGSALVSYFAARRFKVRAFQRSQPVTKNPAVEYVKFELHNVADNGFAGADYLIHCAYQPVVSRQDKDNGIDADEVAARRIVELARKHGIKIIFLSTFSAHTGALSYYAGHKLKTERVFDVSRDLIIRIGIVLGPGGGLFGRILSAIKGHRFIPLIDGGRQLTQTVALDDLCKLIEAGITRNIVGSYNISHPRTVALKDLYEEMAASTGRKHIFINIPWGFVYYPILIAETIGIRFPFKAENVLGLRDLRTYDTTGDVSRFGIRLKDYVETLERLRSDTEYTDKMSAVNTERTGTTPDLSVVVLCYKSGRTIIHFIEQLESDLSAAGISNYELILVGNYFPGTGDTTPDIIRSLAGKNSRIVPVIMEKKGMMGWDMISGLKAAAGGVVAVTDGDGQMPAGDIVRLYKILKRDKLDLAKPYRQTRMDGPYRKFISFWYNVIFRVIFPGVNSKDVNAKPKLITADALGKMELTCSGWFVDAEIMLEAGRLKLKIGEVPTVFHENKWRKSFVKPGAILEFLYDMAVYRIKYWIK